MAVLFVRFKGKFRKLIDGRGCRCEQCNRPINFRINGSGYEPIPHKCKRRPGRVIHPVDDDGENGPDDEEQLEGARIERGFAMMEMRSDLDYASL